MKKRCAEICGGLDWASVLQDACNSPTPAPLKSGNYTTSAILWSLRREAILTPALGLKRTNDLTSPIRACYQSSSSGSIKN